MKKILITGSSGFLGNHLTKFLEKKKYKLILINSKNCDLTNYKNLIKFSKIKFDLIFHLAAWTQAGDFCLRHPGKQWLINQQINTNQPSRSSTRLGLTVNALCGYLWAWQECKRNKRQSWPGLSVLSTQRWYGNCGDKGALVNTSAKSEVNDCPYSAVDLVP